MFSAQARAVVRFVITDGMLTFMGDDEMDLIQKQAISVRRYEHDGHWIIFANEGSELSDALYRIQERYHGEEG